jgi:hypothetical protein
LVLCRRCHEGTEKDTEKKSWKENFKKKQNITKRTKILNIQRIKGKGKDQGVSVYVMKAEGVRSVVVNITPRPLYSMERNPLPAEQEAGWAPDPV